MPEVDAANFFKKRSRRSAKHEAEVLGEAVYHHYGALPWSQGRGRTGGMRVDDGSVCMWLKLLVPLWTVCFGRVYSTL